MGAYKVTGYGRMWRWTAERGWEYRDPCNAPQPETGTPCSRYLDHPDEHSWEEEPTDGLWAG